MNIYMYVLVPMNMVFIEQEFLWFYKETFHNMTISAGRWYLLTDIETFSLEYN